MPAPADMDEDYKGHHIRSVPRHLPDSNRWTAHVVINWTGSRKEIRQFEVKRGFATQEEAEREGLIFAKKWIDDGKPKLRERLEKRWQDQRLAFAACYSRVTARGSLSSLNPTNFECLR
jgi:hypothetical protein